MIRDRILDRLVLEPSRRSLPCEGLRRETLVWPKGEIEAFLLTVEQPSVNLASEESLRWTVLKYPGTSGRAESIGPQPFPFWPGTSGTVVGVNPPGYGRSTGRARLRDSQAMVDACESFLRSRFPETLHVISGNSLGGVRALDHASRYSIAGGLIRNAPPLAELIAAAAARRGLGWCGKWLAGGLPAGWDATAAAARVTVPTLWISSEQDRLVPCPAQQRLFECLAGPKRRLVVPGIDHHEPIPETFLPELREAYAWLRDAVLNARRASG